MGLVDWLQSKAGLAGHDIVSTPGVAYHLALAALPSRQDFEHPLRFNAHSAGQQWSELFHHPIASYQDTARGKYGRGNANAALQFGELLGGIGHTVEHPLRDPFQTALLLAPFLKGFRGGVAAEAGPSLHDLVPNRASKGPADLVKHFTEPPRHAQEVFKRITPEPPRHTEDVVQQIANKLGIHRDEVARQMRAAEQHNHNITNDVIHGIASKNRGIAQMLHAHGMSEHTPQGQPDFVEHIRQVIHTDRIPEQARVYRGRKVNVGKTGLVHGIHNIVGGGEQAAREAALRRILDMHHHFRN